jgi:hypothetical protein
MRFFTKIARIVEGGARSCPPTVHLVEKTMPGYVPLHIPNRTEILACYSSPLRRPLQDSRCFNHTLDNSIQSNPKSATGTSSIFLFLTYTVAGTISESLLDLFFRLFLLEIVHLHLPLPSSSSFPSSSLPPYIPFAPGWFCLVLCRAALHRL